jgi:hypothetical protein
MADKGIRGFYLVIDTIKNELLSNPNITTCTFGDITDIDLQKQTMFPLAHIIIESCTNAEKTLQFSFTILTMEQIDTKKEYSEDLFTGNTNTQDILNTQLAVSNRLVSRLRSGELYADGYQLVGDPTCEPFFDRFENVLAGWSTSFTVEIFNDIYNC